jgi:hypothetical protein
MDGGSAGRNPISPRPECDYMQAKRIFIMSAESEQLNEQITQSVALLRRHL